MDRLNCSLCNQLIDGGFDGLVRHLTGIHGLTINRGMGNQGFECGQGGCRSRFAKFYSLRRHIRKHHLIGRNNEFRETPEHDSDHQCNELINDEIEIADNNAEDLNDNPVVDSDVDFEFRTFIIGMIARFQCEDSMTGRTLTQVLDECEELLLQTRNFLKAKVKRVLQEKKVLNDSGLEDVLQVFDFESPFRGQRTLDKQIDALKIKCEYIEPTEVPLDYRVDDELDDETDESIDGKASLVLTNDDLLQLKIKTSPRKCTLKIPKETKDDENAILGNYTVEDNGTLQRLYLSVPTSASTAKEQCSDEPCPSIPCPSIEQPGPSAAQPGPSVAQHEPSVAQPEPIQSSTQSKPSADSYSRYNTIEEVLINHPQGKSVLKAAQTAFTEESRRALIRILVAELVNVHDSHYPPEQAKIALAMAIVGEFPLLRDRKSTKGYEHYYDSITKRGFIEYRLWTMRKNLSPTKKKYNAPARRKKTPTGKHPLVSANRLKQLPEEELDEKISWMRRKKPTDGNKTAIIARLKETFANRRNWITEEYPKISEVFDKYPRLFDYKGEAIELEFEKMFEGAANNFLARFPSYYSPRILAYSSSHRPDLYKMTSDIYNDHLRALVILVQLLPVTNAQKKRKRACQASAGKKRMKKQPLAESENDDPDEDEFDCAAASVTSAEIPNRFLIQTVRESENLPNFVKKVRQESGSIPQPYLIQVCGRSKETFIVQGDGWSISAHNNNNPMVAFDLLFKCYYVLNVKYPVSLQNFFNFMECYVYKVQSQTQSIVSSVHVNIANTKLNTGKTKAQRRNNISDDD